MELHDASFDAGEGASLDTFARGRGRGRGAGLVDMVSSGAKVSLR